MLLVAAGQLCGTTLQRYLNDIPKKRDFDIASVDQLADGFPYFYIFGTSYHDSWLLRLCF